MTQQVLLKSQHNTDCQNLDASQFVTIMTHHVLTKNTFFVCLLEAHLGIEINGW